MAYEHVRKFIVVWGSSVALLVIMALVYLYGIPSDRDESLVLYLLSLVFGLVALYGLLHYLESGGAVAYWVRREKCLQDLPTAVAGCRRHYKDRKVRRKGRYSEGRVTSMESTDGV